MYLARLKTKKKLQFLMDSLVDEIDLHFELGMKNQQNDNLLLGSE